MPSNSQFVDDDKVAYPVLNYYLQHFKLINKVENGVDLRKYSRCYFIKVQFIKFRFFILSQWL